MQTRTRKAGIAALAAMVMVLGLTTAASADDKGDLQKKKRDLNSKIEDAQGDADHSTKKLRDSYAALKAAKQALASAQGELGRTRGELAVAEARDREMQDKLVRTEKALQVAIAKLAQGEADLKDAEATVEQFTVNQIQQGDSGMRAFNRLLAGESPSSFTEEMSINDSVGDAQIAKMQELDAARVILKLKRDEVEELRDQVKKARAEAAANLKTKQALEAAAEQQAVQVAQLVAKNAKAKNAADSALAEDLALLRNYEAERNRVNAKLAAIAARNVRTGGRGVGGDGGGTLSAPVNGPITSVYGMRRHPITGVYKLHDGTDFGVGCGTPIRAAASGTIIEQYFNAGYGNRVILDNGVKRGQSVMTTYNHLSRFALGAGAKVQRGDVIGYVGSTGYSTGCHLHFMVIVNGATVNPMGWL